MQHLQLQKTAQQHVTNQKKKTAKQTLQHFFKLSLDYIAYFLISKNASEAELTNQQIVGITTATIRKRHIK